MKRGIVALVLTAAAVWTLAAALGLRAVARLFDRTAVSTSEPRPKKGSAVRTAHSPLPQEEKAIRAAVPLGYRPATGLDSEETPERQDLEDLYRDYQPYFVRGDLNGDGVLDFVTAYVAERGEAPVFDVVVFLGRPGGAFSEPIAVQKGIPLSFGDISIDRSIVVITPDLKNEVNRRFRFVPESSTFEDVDSASHDQQGPERSDEPPEESPDHRIRVRT